ncbi:type III secretion system chaperone [Verrucomicrobium sp. BvORR106]|uniref:type III secretion system chaperone n=1 Tax=Verrucomicrobium sp. BvORR106 TaxID=1403819 RepID=UPI000571BD91|nr:type III secretion system chaperone [Verrucomicrobium sp. BvORR106]
MADNDTSAPTPSTEPANLETLMAEVGPLIDAGEVRQYEPTRWAIAFDDDFGVEVEHDVDLNKLVLYTNLGHPPAGDETASYKLLLHVATMWRETGGLRMGLDPVDDTVVQIYDFPLAGVELEDLEVQIRNFADTALHARKILAGGTGTAAQDGEGADDGLHFMRV